MNAFQKFIEGRAFGFVTAEDLPELVRLHRLCQVLVRCGGCRFTCAAQDVGKLIGYAEKSGDYVRDVSVTPAEIERAAAWMPEPVFSSEHKAQGFSALGSAKVSRGPAGHFNDADCGGVFDGFSVSSDADPGL